MKQNYLVFKNKNSLISCILLALTVGFIMLGLSVAESMEHDWKTWNKNDVLFRTYFITNDLKQSDIEELKKLDEVEDVISDNAYEIIASNEFLEDNFTSNMTIKGMPREELNKLTNSEESESLICSDKFRPRNVTMYYNDIDYIDLNSFINSDIELKFNNSSEKLKLVGLYNNELFYSDDDICYTSYENVLNLNNKYNKKDSNKYYVIANKSVNAKKMGDILKEKGYSFNNISYTNNNKKDEIIKYTFIITVIVGLLMIIGTYIFIVKNKNKYHKDEIFMQGLITYALAIVISFTGFLIFENYFLAGNNVFNKMDMTYSYVALIIGVLITFLGPVIVNIRLKKKK